MRSLALSPKFQRSYRKFVRRNANLQKRIDDVLMEMQLDVFSEKLNAHKLSGELFGLWACSCGYDCRVIFSIEIDSNTGEEVILLLDIGTHDQVY